jgi:hypothetical protein
MGKTIEVTVFTAWLAASVALSACAEVEREPSSTLGILNAALTGAGESGVTYRLRRAAFTIRGGQAVDFTSEEYPELPSIQIELPADQYTITLAPGWSLERGVNSVFEPVPATLTSPAAAQSFAIAAGRPTSVLFRFSAEGDPVQIGTGTLNLQLAVDDQSDENTLAACTDGRDNDHDNLLDCADPQCGSVALCHPVAPARGDIVIPELMNNSLAVPSGHGRWFEVSALSATPLDLAGCRVLTGPFSWPISSTFSFPPGSLMLPGQTLIFANELDPAINGGIADGYQKLELGWARDGINVYLECTGVGVIDQVLLQTSLIGISLQLDPMRIDRASNDDPANWCRSVVAFGAGDLGTPGLTNTTCF